jgi:cytochrome P450 family 307 subfamily A
MAFLGLYLFYIVLVLLLIIYIKLVYACKRGVKVTVDVVKSVKENSGTVQTKIEVLPQPPGPIPWPILGNLAMLGQYKVPFEGFSAISKIYGDVYSLTLGTTRCVVVSNLEIIKEVLNQNGKYFGGRPNFEVKIETQWLESWQNN